MAKKYQIFISSTYLDLQKEREIALGAVLSLGHMPVGMELFPSTDNDPLRYIKGVIDNCDYYLLLVAGRYGSVDKGGVSFTEREFDYAVSKGLHVVAFTRDDLASLPPAMCEADPARIDALQSFRDKVGAGRLAQPWRSEMHLQGLIYPSLITAFADHPRKGWVRDDDSQIAQAEYQIHALTERCSALEKELAGVRGKIPVLDNQAIAGLDHAVPVRVTYTKKSYSNYRPTYDRKNFTASTTFGECFSIVGPYLMQPRWDSEVDEYLATELARRKIDRDLENISSIHLEETAFRTIQSQFQALGLITAMSSTGGAKTGLAWHLTELGQKQAIVLRVVKPAATA